MPTDASTLPLPVPRAPFEWEILDGDTWHKALCLVSRPGILGHARPHARAYLWLVLNAALEVA
eukprot:COSAG02_NODE_19884_length_860_cov_1.180026_1_plen_63_part_00